MTHDRRPPASRTCTSLPSATRLWSTPVSECVLDGHVGKGQVFGHLAHGLQLSGTAAPHRQRSRQAKPRMHTAAQCTGLQTAVWSRGVAHLPPASWSNSRCLMASAKVSTCAWDQAAENGCTPATLPALCCPASRRGTPAVASGKRERAKSYLSWTCLHCTVRSLQADPRSPVRSP